MTRRGKGRHGGNAHVDSGRQEAPNAFLARASRLLADSLDYETTLRTVAALALPYLQAWCIVDIVEREDGRPVMRRVAIVHPDPEKYETARELEQTWPPEREDPIGAPVVLRTREPQVIPDVTDEMLQEFARDPSHLDQLRALEIGSILVIPLVARGHVLGAMTFVSPQAGRTYTESDLVMAEDLAARCAVAIDRARLYQEAEEARRQAERRAREERALRNGAEAVATAYTLEKVVDRIAHSALEATGADMAAVERIDAEHGKVEVVAGAGAPGFPVGTRIPYPGSLAERATEAGEPVRIERLSADPKAPPNLVRFCGDCAALAVPMEALGEAIGAILLLRTPEQGGFTDDEASRATAFARLASLAFSKVHLLEEAEEGQKELQELLESRSRLVRGFSHDVKNPLAAAEGRLSLMTEGLLDGLTERQRENVERVRRSIGTALRLIDSLSEFARTAAGQVTIECTSVDVRAVAEEIAEEQRPAAAAEGLELKLELADELPVVHSDPDRIRQILGNLVSNAVKYTEAGRIRVRVRGCEDGRAPRPGRWVCVEVSDTGPGIPRDKQEVVFGEFTRLEPGKGRGAGLGLAISRRLARLLGGDVTLDSEVGRGSTFTLWLPRIEPGAGGGMRAGAEEGG